MATLPGQVGLSDEPDVYLSGLPQSGPRKVRVGPLGLLSALIMFRRLSRSQLDDDKPGIVAGSARISRLRSLARTLAREGREDEAAVEQLTALARNRPVRLLRAAASVRQEGFVHDEAVTYRANELLQAAATGRPVRRVSPDQQAWFDRVEQLVTGSPEQAFARVQLLQPALGAVEAAARELADSPDLPALGSRQWLELSDRFDRDIDQLVGPNAGQVEPVLRSGLVYGAVHAHIIRLIYGLAE